MSDVQATRLSWPYPGPSLPSPRHIRLVHLEPGSDEAINCELTTICIDSASHYEALSYTWGDPSRKETIKMTTQGSETTQAFSVTSNCFSALKRLRYQDRSRVLWIDALAIDQSDIDERNHQVSLMSRIYSQASGVIVYLGDAADNSDFVIELIMDCYSPSSGSGYLSVPKSVDPMQSLRAFFSRPWFTRVWVIQEVFLSTKRTIYCGDKEMPWSAMENFRGYATNSILDFQLPYVASTSNRHLDTRTAEELMFWALLDSRHCEATDPRDKVYSLLSIFQFHNKSISLTPQYHDTVAKVYTDCSLALLPGCGWEILYTVQSRSSTADLPSWVPDWNVPPQRSIVAYRNSQREIPWADKVLPGISEKPQVIMRHSDNGKIPLLCGYGYSVGKVLEIGSTFIAGQTLFPTKEWYYLASKIDSSSRLESFSYFLEFVHEIESSKGEKEDSDSDSDSDLDNDEDSDKDSDKDLDKDKDEDEDEDRNFGSGWLQWPKTMRHMALHMKDGVLPFKDIPFDQAADGLPPSYRRIILDHLVGEGNLQDGAWYDKVKEDSQPQPLYII